MPEHTTGAAENVDTPMPESSDQGGQPSWAGAMAQIDAEIAELQQMLAKRRAESAALAAEDDGPDSVA